MTKALHVEPYRKPLLEKLGIISSVALAKSKAASEILEKKRRSKAKEGAEPVAVTQCDLSQHFCWWPGTQLRAVLCRARRARQVSRSRVAQRNGPSAA